MAAALTTNDRYWVVPIVRASIALVAAAVITFAMDHSPRFGLIIFGCYAIIAGIAIALLSWRTMAPGITRTMFLMHGIVGVVVGGVALCLQNGGLGWFLYLVSIWGAITGFTELYCGIRSRRRLASARDWIVIGALTAVMALLFLVIPPDISQHFTEEKIERTLTSSVILVGILGAYCAIVCVYLGIGGFSLKWAAQQEKPKQELGSQA